MKTKYLLLVVFLFTIFQPLFAQKEDSQTQLTIDKIMQDPNEWIGSLPDDILWSQDSKTIYFRWNPENKPVEDLYKINIKEQTPQKASKKEEKRIQPRSSDLNSSKTKKVYSVGGRLYLHDIKENTSQLIFQSSRSIRSPNFTHNDQGVTFVMDGDFFKWNIRKKQLTQLIDFTHKPKKRQQRKTQKKKWLHNQQMELFETLERRKEEETYEDSIRETYQDKVKSIFVGKAFVTNVQLSPSGRYITYNLYQRGKTKNTKVPHYVNETGYLEIEDARSKVGGRQYGYELHIYDTKKDSAYPVETSNIPGIKDRLSYLKASMKPGEANKPRKVHTSGPYWSDNGKNALISVRAADNKDRWLMLLDLATGKPELLDRQRDTAWIGGPGISRSFRGEDLGWLPDNKHIWYQSEESGYSHLYILNIENKKEKALTSGEFEIYNPRISKNDKYWYFNANKAHPGERHFYRMPLKGGKMEQLTFREGRNDVTLSPDEKHMAIRHSASNEPWEIYLKKNKPKAESIQLTNSLTEKFKSYNWRKPEFITFEADDGAMVHARLYKPQKPANSNKSAVIFVHGAGYKQNAHKWWSSYFREYMFHNFLVDQGYTVLDIDYRGSAGYGRDWRTAIYRHMGGKDLSDQVDGAEYLINNHNINSDKIGIYGGSYGGFITLMALFKEADTFAAGAALRSVTDWAHYNHSYTSNILNKPTNDSIAYRRSSPIYYADGLEDPLLMCHGMIDDNVQFQDIVRLTQRLIELGKENWELAVYPLERHSFREPESWRDEYKRIYKLFEENL
jgi:dipeptidyl aminopeptidase/acylaminoacyl peptidase